MKTCPFCNTERPDSEFQPGHRKCNPCVRADDSSRMAEYYEANKSTVLVRRAAYHIANRAAISKRKAAYYIANKAKCLEAVSRRKRCEKGQTPSWADRSKIVEIYKDAAEFREAGLDVHVDHIIPLKAKLASGLHVHQNLTIKLAQWNDSKGNKFDV